MKKKEYKKTFLAENSTIRDTIKNLEKSALQVALVIKPNKLLIGTITDGDIRRGLLSGLKMEDSVKKVVNRSPLVATLSMSKSMMNKLMKINQVHQLPIVDKSKKVIGLYIWDEINYLDDRKNLVVIMAGGKGKRMLPFTKDCPKPLLPLGDKPILEHILIKAKSEGFFNYVFSINYLGNMIKNFFGNGKRFNIKIKYLMEKFPLGTAGALSLLKPRPKYPFIVCNGDVISDIKLSELLDFHIRNNAFATMAVKPYEIKNPYGVAKIKGNEIINLEEKPVIKSHINTGVYVLDPLIFNYLTKNKYLDMNILFKNLIKKSKKVLAYPAYETWLDLGRPKDFNRASRKIKSVKK